MTSAELKKERERERNRRNYERRKAEKLKAASDPVWDEALRRLSIVPDQAPSESVEIDVERWPVMDSRGISDQPVDAVESAPSTPDSSLSTPVNAPPKDEQIAVPAPLPQAVPRDHWLTRFGTVSRWVLVIALTALMTVLQVDFYKAHDIMPQFAWILAIACEVSFLSIVSMKFERHDWIRWLVCAIFFAYTCATLSFHIVDRARSNILSESTVERTQLEADLSDAKARLAIATQGRSWDNMRALGDEVTRLQGLIRDIPKAKALGISSSQRQIVEAVLLIALRALIMISVALNAAKLREDFARRLIPSRSRPG